jgi:hypothetical protein
MDPLTIIVSALAAGASALGAGAVKGLTNAASDAVASAYRRLKERVLQYATEAGVDSIERKPESVAKRESLIEDLAGTAAEEDEQLLVVARELVEQLKAGQPQAGRAIGVDLEQIEGESLRIERVRAQGTGVQVKGARIRRGIHISDIDSGRSEENHPRTR